MNNSLLAQYSQEDEAPDVTPYLREKQTELAKIHEALKAIKSSSYWKLLEESLWSKDLAHLQHRIEAEKDVAEIYRLQGEIKRVKKYADLNTLAEVFSKELQLIQLRLESNGNENSPGDSNVSGTQN